jgi:HK97 family phage prohead protease
MPKIQTPAREVRTIRNASPLELRAENGQNTVSGYAVVFNSESLDLGGFTEICAPGMLDRTLTDSPDVLCLRDHKQELLLGRTTANTLALKTDSKGLRFTLSLPNSPTGADAAEAIRRGDLTSCSFGFSTVNDDWMVSPDGSKVIRTLLDVDLYEISITSFPAYEATSVRSAPAEIRSRLTVRDLADGAELAPNMDKQDAGEEQESLDPACDPDSPDYDPDSDDCDDDRNESADRARTRLVLSLRMTRRSEDDCDEDVQDEDGNCPGDAEYEGEYDEDSRNPCECRCVRCQYRDCARCEDRDCRDENCSACPSQDSERTRLLLSLKIK